MNISCSICTEYLVPESESFSTQCGHIFHHTCLIQWIERSKTCPQCRCKTTEKSIHKVFLHDNNTTITETVGSMLNKLSSMEIHCQKIKDKNELFKNRNMGLRLEIKTLEDKCSLNESTASALKEQMLYYKNKCKNQGKLEEEIIRLKEKIKTMEDVETVIAGSNEQVKDMLKHNRDPHSLHILIVTLKNELITLEKQKRIAIQRMKEAQTDATNSRKTLRDSQLENSNYRQQLETLKTCESERLYLKKQLKRLKEDQHKTADAFNMEKVDRVLFESPAPMRAMKRKSQLDNTMIDFSEALDSPFHVLKNGGAHSLEQEEPAKVNTVSASASASPYLPIKCSNVINQKAAEKFGKFAAPSGNSMSIFNKNMQRNKLEMKPYKPSAEVTFDGLGGHSKEDLYPTPIKKFRRKTATALTSSTKFKKLAPHNSKLDKFLYASSPGSSGSNT